MQRGREQAAVVAKPSKLPSPPFVVAVNAERGEREREKERERQTNERTNAYVS